MMTNVAVLRPKEIEKIVEVIQKLLESSFTTRSTRITESLLSADFIDDLQVEKYMEMESNENKLHFLLMECLGSLVHHYSVITLPLMDTYLLPQIMECSDESRTIGDRRMAVVLMMRVIEYGDRLVFKYYPSFIPVFLREMKSSDSELRDVAVNGIGYAAEKGQDLICEVVAASVTEIERLVEDEFSSTEAFYSVNANAIISLGKLCVYVGHYLIRLRDHVQFFLCRLPLNCNHNHTSYRWWSYVSRETHCDVLQILCLIYERYARDVVEECNQVILPILQYFCDSIDNPSLDISMSLKTRILRTLLKIQCQLPSSIMNALWEYLGSEKTRNIQAYCVRFM